MRKPNLLHKCPSPASRFPQYSETNNRNVAKPETKHLVHTLHAATVDREMPPSKGMYRYSNILCPDPSEVLVPLHRQLSSLVMQKPHNTGSHITAQLQFSTNNSCLAIFNYPSTMRRHQCMPQLAEGRSVQKERVLSYPIVCAGRVWCCKLMLHCLQPCALCVASLSQATKPYQRLDVALAA